MKTKLTLLIITLFCFTVSHGQKLTGTDSIAARNATQEFFDWYLAAIKGRIHSGYQPTFIKGKDGMTTLDFKEYFNNLKKHHFSDDLIRKERESYNGCLKNLATIKFVDFETNFKDLDQFERIDCDFGNSYRWTGGQEPIEGITIKTVQQPAADRILITLEYSIDNGKNYGITRWGKNKVTMSKINGHWEITDLNWGN